MKIKTQYDAPIEQCSKTRQGTLLMLPMEADIDTSLYLCCKKNEYKNDYSSVGSAPARRFAASSSSGRSMSAPTSVSSPAWTSISFEISNFGFLRTFTFLIHTSFSGNTLLHFLVISFSIEEAMNFFTFSFRDDLPHSSEMVSTILLRNFLIWEVWA